MTSSVPATQQLPLDSQRLWTLANKIEEKQLWAGFLSEQEHVLYRTALLRGRDVWDAFLDGRFDQATEQDQDVNNSNNTASAKTANNEKGPDVVTTAFRTRNMLFDCYIRKLFPSRTGEDLMDFHVSQDTTATAISKPVEEKPKTREIEEDNYDDDDEEEEEEPPATSQLQLSQSTEHIGISFRTWILLSDEPPPLPEIKSYPIHTYYHTLEHDRVAMLELQTVEVLPPDVKTDCRNSTDKTTKKSPQTGLIPLYKQ